MKAIQLEKPEHFRTIEIAEPKVAGSGEALVQVHRVGICGSDISGYLGKMPFYSYPRIPGHELGVEVLAVGANVTHLKPGDKCSVEPYMNCQRCFACLQGHSNCCKTLKVLGVHTDGGSEAARLEDLGNAHLPPLVIAATGSVQSMSNAFNYLGHTGRMVYVGIVPADTNLPDPIFHSREQTLYASRNAVPTDFTRIINLIEPARSTPR